MCVCVCVRRLLANRLCMNIQRLMAGLIYPPAGVARTRTPRRATAPWVLILGRYDLRPHAPICWSLSVPLCRTLLTLRLTCPPLSAWQFLLQRYHAVFVGWHSPAGTWREWQALRRVVQIAGPPAACLLANTGGMAHQAATASSLQPFDALHDFVLSYATKLGRLVRAVEDAWPSAAVRIHVMRPPVGSLPSTWIGHRLCDYLLCVHGDGLQDASRVLSNLAALGDFAQSSIAPRARPSDPAPTEILAAWHVALG